MLIDDNSPQVFCVNETWLKPQIPDPLLSTNGYKLIRLDRSVTNTQGYTKRGGGLAMYNKQIVNYVILNNQPFATSNIDLEFHTVKINRKHTRLMYIVSIYCPPSGNLDSMYTLLTELLSNLDNADKATIIIGGDFNIDF